MGNSILVTGISLTGRIWSIKGCQAGLGRPWPAQSRLTAGPFFGLVGSYPRGSPSDRVGKRPQANRASSRCDSEPILSAEGQPLSRPWELW